MFRSLVSPYKLALQNVPQGLLYLKYQKQCLKTKMKKHTKSVYSIEWIWMKSIFIYFGNFQKPETVSGDRCETFQCKPVTPTNHSALGSSQVYSTILGPVDTFRLSLLCICFKLALSLLVS